MDDRVRVGQLLGREPRGAFDVVVRDEPAIPWSCATRPSSTTAPRCPPATTSSVSRSSRGEPARSRRRRPRGRGRRRPRRTSARRTSATPANATPTIPAGHVGPRPTGGVGGTRTGVKCLHAHVAHCLAGGDDPVGRWALDALRTPEVQAVRDVQRPPGVRIGDHTVEICTTDGAHVHAARRAARRSTTARSNAPIHRRPPC